MKAMLSVEDALERIVAGVGIGQTERIPVSQAMGRTLAYASSARLTQPPAALSAMDGYAVRSVDTAPQARLRVIGEAPAGHPFGGTIGAGQAVRLFTGSVLPEGADAVIVQEDAEREGAFVTIALHATPGRHVRIAGLDFRDGQELVAAGTRLHSRHLGLIAAGNNAMVEVVRRPRIAMLSTGDELRPPGTEDVRPGQIIASSLVMMAAAMEQAGAEVIALPIVSDRHDAIAEAVWKAEAANVDILVTLGGASVGDHDLVRDVMADLGMDLDFWTVAMRPGKPLMHGRLGAMRVLGLPGNPVSSFVCGEIFLKPLIEAMLGRFRAVPYRKGVLAAALPKNGPRTHFLRARFSNSADAGAQRLEACADQDSSMLTPLAAADALILQDAGCPGKPVGETVTYLPLLS